ncbi:MFS transporter [Peribacillus saganii]|uniref:MFS transporter n=1 Tax=Peribacillus saganii TaxID=2303992 RepID=A0A372LMF7_9BACI|nr:MFS transporter [Peribacillus saganii]RFU68097.1 MFS transporter [Peribacillus saganii]
MNEKPLWTKDFFSISLCSFFLFLTFYMLLTALPIYVTEDLKGDEKQIGLIITVFLIAAVICRPFTGIWVEDFGRKRILYISLLIFGVASLLYPFADSFPLMIALRFFHGIGFGMATTATTTIVADLVPDERRGEGMGYFAMSMNLAMVIGPFLGLTLSANTGFTVIFIVCIITALFAVILGLLVKFPTDSPGKIKPQKSNLSFNNLFEKSVIPISIVGGILAITYASLLSFLSVFAKETGLEDTAGLFFVVYAVVIIASRPFTGKWLDQYGENKIIYPGIIIFILGMYLLSQTETTFSLLLSGAIIGLGFGSLVPSFQTVAVSMVSPKRRGIATATFFTVFDIGVGAGSFFMGMIAAKTSYSFMYLSASFIILIGLVLYYLLHGRKQNKKMSESNTF